MGLGVRGGRGISARSSRISRQQGNAKDSLTLKLRKANNAVMINYCFYAIIGWSPVILFIVIVVQKHQIIIVLLFISPSNVTRERTLPNSCRLEIPFPMAGFTLRGARGAFAAFDALSYQIR